MLLNLHMINRCVAYLFEGQKSAETPLNVIASPSDINIFKVIVCFVLYNEKKKNKSLFENDSLQQLENSPKQSQWHTRMA